MERLSIQPTPAGSPVDEDTLQVLSQSEDFVRRDDGTFRFAHGDEHEWALVGLPTKATPTVQRLNLDGGGVIFWFSAIHTGTAMFEYKQRVSAVPSRQHLFAAVL